MDADERHEGGTDDLGLGDDGRASAQNPMVRKAISLKLKPQKAKGKGEAKLQDLSVPASEAKYSAMKDHKASADKLSWEHKASADKLSWEHKVELFGEKVIDPLIHCCEQCQLPILIYGRMIPCKHVYCLDCARKTTFVCPRCGDPVQRIEECALGTVFLCTFGGAKHGVSGCRRTYLSPRDLQAHVTHRHVKLLPPPLPPPPPPIAMPQQPLSQLHVFSAPPVAVPPVPPSLSLDARTLPSAHVPTMAFLHPMHHRVNLSQPPPTGAASVPVRSEPRESFSVPLVRTSSNLITIPIQDDIEFSTSNASSSGSGSLSTFSQQPQLHYSQPAGHSAAIASFNAAPTVPYPAAINSGSQALHASMLTMHHAMPPLPQPHLGQPVPGVQPPIAPSIQPQGNFVPVPAQVTAQWGRQPPPSQQQHGMQPYY